MALGQLVLEESGKITGTRVLPEGKMEQSFQGSGKLLGMDFNSFYTAISTPQPGGVLLFEANGIGITKEGDTITFKIFGVTRLTGAGFKGTIRGGTINQTASPKLANLNNAVTCWEVEVDEPGNYHLKIWEWK
jgi:hypothetical protein